MDKVLIANRGEITRRIAQTVAKMGMKSVAILDSSHRQPPDYLGNLVDEFAYVDGYGADVFLNQDLLLRLANDFHVDAIHPGFGYLSENAAFAAKVIQAGIAWIGPSPSAIELMASKEQARKLALDNEVPCVPGLSHFSFLPGPAFADLQHKADTIGYPLIIKAAMGGGGKGMRLVEQPSGLEEALQRAASEAKSSFGDDKLVIEKYLTQPRHVEIQILADQYGNVITLAERDCSVQRRHQKIIEEAPALALTEDVRQGLHKAAEKIAQIAKYSNAGTVEFLVDRDANGKQSFYFLEMNTRLQVEHPVTEEIFGIDLVEWQFRMAQGEKLPQELNRLKHRGHSIEARLYAENPLEGFQPAPGAIECFTPYQGPGIRWEWGLDQIDLISPYYDPMIAKVIATASTRQNALSLLKTALENSVIIGTANNQSYLIEILSDPLFRDGQPSTNYIGNRHDDLLTKIHRRQDALDSDVASSDIVSDIAFAQVFAEQSTQNDQIHRCIKAAFSAKDTAIELIKDQRFHSFDGSKECQTGTARTRSFPMRFRWCHVSHSDRENLYFVRGGLSHQRMIRQSPNRARESVNMTDSDVVHAPVPGKIVKLAVTSGDKVEKNQCIMILESMKMEFEVKAGKFGIIEEISVSVGQQVEAEQVVARWQP